MRSPAILLTIAFTASMAATFAAQEAVPAPTILGEGRHRYRWVEEGFRLADGADLGNTHGCIVIDHEGRVYVNTDTEKAVCVFDAEGRFLEAWGKEFAGGLHGMTLVVEDGKEYLWLAHTARHEAVKTTLKGEVLATIGVPMESGRYEDAGQYHPTSVVVAPNGDIYVADGYGRSWIHRFSKDRKYLGSFGGPGTEPGKLRTPHGMLLDDRGDEPVLLVADRENHRLQSFSLDGRHLGVFAGNLRRPCNIQRMGDAIVVADLAGRVTILDRKNDLVCHLGDNPDESLRAQNGVPKEKWVIGRFLSPHASAVDPRGNLYVMDWNSLGRVRRLVRVDG